jgi:predicted nucleotidyltransferase
VTVANATQLDPASAAFVADVLATIDAEVPIFEAFVIGSGATGPFDPATSDIDLVVVVEGPLGAQRGALLERLARLEPPGRDLELVLYVKGTQPPDVELNVNGGEERPDEPTHWFVLDAALAQQEAAPVWRGRPWSELFDRVEPERIEQAMRESLAWSERQPPDDEFARVNALRARHYLERGEWLSKADAKARR